MGISLNPATLLSGQGIDVSSIVSQIIAGQSGELTEWQNEQTTLQTQATALTNINNDLNNLATAVQALTDPAGALSGVNATSSQPDILTASAQSSATPATYQLVVNSLASPSSVYSNELANGTTSFLASGQTTGVINLQVGNTNTPINVTAGSNDTLSTLASYINENPSLGVTAQVITDATGSRLLLTSQSSSAVSVSGSTNITLNFTSVGGNASFTVNGVPYTSSSNTVTNLPTLPGVTVNLLSASPGTPVQLTIGPNAAAASQAINNFVSAYNTVVGDLNTQYSVDPTTDTEGPLGSDEALRSLQSSLLNDVTYSLPGSGTGVINNGIVNLATLGVSMNDDGTLSVNTVSSPGSPSLASVLASNPAAVQNFFQNTSQTGLAQVFNKDLTNLTDPTSGVLNNDLSQNSAQQQTLTNNINDFEVQLLAEQQQLTTEFENVNASLQAYPLTLQEVTETIASLTSSPSTTSSVTLPTLTSGL